MTVNAALSSGTQVRSPSATGALLAILVGAFALRLWGVDYGLPFPLVSDEEVMIGGAMRMLELRTVLPVLHPEPMSILYYPVVLPYLYMAVMTPFLGILYLVTGTPSLDVFALHVFDNMGTIFLLSRLTSVVFATLTIYVVYRIGLLVFRRQSIALAAAALMATDFLSVFLGHFARHWSATVLAIWLTVWLACLIYQRQERKHYVLAGLVGGIGFGISYIGCLGLVVVGVAHIARNGIRRLFTVPAWLMTGVFVALAALFIVIHPQAVIRLIAPQGILPLEDAKTVQGYLDTALFYARAMVYSNPVLTAGFVIGLLIALVDKRYWLFVAAIAALTASLGSLFYALPLEDRYFMPVIPLMALIAAYGAVRLVDRITVPATRRVTAGVLVATQAYAVVVSGWSAVMLSRDDTRQLAKAWVEETLPADTRVAVAQNSVKIPTTAAALKEQKTLDPNSLKAADRARLRAGNVTAEPGSDAKIFHALHLSQMTKFGPYDVTSSDVLPALTGRGYEYLIADYKEPDEITGLHAAARRGAQLVARFEPGDGDDLPPFLRSTILIDRPLYHLLAYERFGTAVELFRLPGVGAGAPVAAQ